MTDQTKRYQEKIEALKNKIVDAGHSDEKVFGFSQHGPGDCKSFAEYMVDRALEGKGDEPIDPEELWKEMKMQINFYLSELSRASDEYLKIQNEVRSLKKDLEDSIKRHKV